MKNSSRFTLSFRRQTGFSLVEMIGVLAIIAVLAVIIVPKVFSTIASARITSAAGSANAMKSAVVEFATKYGSIPLTGNTSRIDDLLVQERLIDSRFAVKIGTPQTVPAVAGGTWSRATGAWVAGGGNNQTGQTRLICVNSNPAAVPSVGTNYRLNGPGSALPAGARVVSAVIVGVTGADARELSFRIDGDGAALATELDDAGKVVYAQPNAATALTNVYIYIAHQ